MITVHGGSSAAGRRHRRPVSVKVFLIDMERGSEYNLQTGMPIDLIIASAAAVIR